MTDQNKLFAAANKGGAAKVQLDAIGDGFEEVKQQYVDAWLRSDVRDTAGREKLWVATTIITLVEKQLRTHVANGRLAESELEKIRKAGEAPSVVDRVKHWRPLVRT